MEKKHKSKGIPFKNWKKTQNLRVYPWKAKKHTISKGIPLKNKEKHNILIKNVLIWIIGIN